MTNSPHLAPPMIHKTRETRKPGPIELPREIKEDVAEILDGNETKRGNSKPKAITSNSSNHQTQEASSQPHKGFCSQETQAPLHRMKDTPKTQSSQEAQTQTRRRQTPPGQRHQKHWTRLWHKRAQSEHPPGSPEGQRPLQGG
jgi:hypothetical protein